MGTESLWTPLLIGATTAVATSAAAKKANAPGLAALPQSSKSPDASAFAKNNATAAMLGPGAGPSSTWLTGTAGVDPSTLNLGKSTLLGS